jgi:hypothetical protein
MGTAEGATGGAREKMSEAEAGALLLETAIDLPPMLLGALGIPPAAIPPIPPPPTPRPRPLGGTRPMLLEV